jgi:hypothetical protein
MSALLVGYARCSTDQQDLTAQRDGLLGLGVEAERIYVDHGVTGTNRDRPGLREALAACQAGDPLVVTRLDRLAGSLPDARAIADELTARQISLSLGASVHDPTGRLRGKQHKLNRKQEAPWSPWCTAASTAPASRFQTPLRDAGAPRSPHGSERPLGRVGKERHRVHRSAAARVRPAR